MNTMQFLLAAMNWLQADPSHVVVVAALANSLIPTPAAGTAAAKIYKVLELFALSFFHAKETGISNNDLIERLAQALVQKQIFSAVATHGDAGGQDRPAPTFPSPQQSPYKGE